MSYLPQNESFLKEKRPKLYEAIADYRRKNPQKRICEQIEEKAAKKGGTYLTVTMNGVTTRLNSAFRPIEEAKRWNEQYNYRNLKTVVSIYGMGNGTFIREILDSLAEDGFLLIMEPCIDIFEYMMENEDMLWLLSDKRVLLFLEQVNPVEFHLFLGQHIHWSNMKSYIHCCHPGYDSLFPKGYKAYLEEIRSITEIAVVNMHTGSYFGKSLTTNAIKNLQYIKDGVSLEELKEHIDNGIPAIIVAAGPSLDKNIELLKEAKGKAYILATDTGVQHLLKRNILPDAMVTLDAKKPVRYMQYDEIKEIPLFCAVEANHEILKLHTGRKIWIRGGDYLSNLYEKFGKKISELNPGGSVATAAFSICVGLGFSRIVLIGQDLAYGEHGTHAGGLTDHVINEQYGIKMIDGIDGKQVKSRHDWIIYRDWFESAIKEVPEIDVIDATEGGALIHGARIMTLREVINSYCQRQTKDRPKELYALKSFAGEAFQKVKEYILLPKTEIEEIQKEANQAHEVAEKVYNKLAGNMDVKEKDLSRYAAQITTVTSQIEKTSVWLLLDIYISDRVTKYMANICTVSDDEKQDLIELFYSSKVVFEAIDEAVDELRPVIAEVSEIIEEQ